MHSDRIDQLFPKLAAQPYRITSGETDSYNCIAWALFDTKQWWWYTPQYGCYWPPGVDRSNNLQSIARIFELHGYRTCESSEHEHGFEKVALYEHPEYGIEHVSRQLEDGQWTSKMGEWEDIQHTSLEALEGSEYGFVGTILKRPRGDWLWK